MAKDKVKATEAVEVKPIEQAPVQKPPVTESVYSAAELANNHKIFNTYREIVVVALRLAGKDSATISEAKKIIEEFKNKEVK